MFDFISKVGQQTAAGMKDEIKQGNVNSFDFKALSTKFSVDVIASCAFGIEVNSFKSPDNDFHKIAKKFTNFASAKTAFKFAGFMVVPQIMKKLGITLIDKESCKFFEEAIAETMKVREQQGIVRHDMINLLLQARKGQLSHNILTEEKSTDGFSTVEESQIGKLDVKRVWEDEDLAAQCFIFFLAGFETVIKIINNN